MFLLAYVHTHAILIRPTASSSAVLQEDEAASSSKAQQQLQQQRPSPRILVAAHTNVAVDRVLLGLQEAGFTNMLRIGSLARIAKRLLGVSLHSAGQRGLTSAGATVMFNTAGESARHVAVLKVRNARRGPVACCPRL
jgi:hypothetical protein